MTLPLSALVTIISGCSEIKFDVTRDQITTSYLEERGKEERKETQKLSGESEVETDGSMLTLCSKCLMKSIRESLLKLLVRRLNLSPNCKRKQTSNGKVIEERFTNHFLLRILIISVKGMLDGKSSDSMQMLKEE